MKKSLLNSKKRSNAVVWRCQMALRVGMAPCRPLRDTARQFSDYPILNRGCMCKLNRFGITPDAAVERELMSKEQTFRSEDMPFGIANGKSQIPDYGICNLRSEIPSASARTRCSRLAPCSLLTADSGITRNGATMALKFVVASVSQRVLKISSQCFRNANRHCSFSVYLTSKHHCGNMSA
jgi:hypothetical protein